MMEVPVPKKEEKKEDRDKQISQREERKEPKKKSLIERILNIVFGDPIYDSDIVMI
jgi:hypothetical protein